MIVAIVALTCVTSVVLGSLVLANSVHKRVCEDDDPRVFSWRPIEWGTPCAICGVERFKNKDGNTRSALQLPVRCVDGECDLAGLDHLHVECNACGATWFMKPKCGN